MQNLVLEWKDRYLTPNLHPLLSSDLIWLHFDYGCSEWYPNIFKKLKKQLQTLQHK